MIKLLYDLFIALHLDPVYSAINRRLRPFEEAKRYTRTNEIGGQCQFDLLKLDGCLPSSKVLEIGCGWLNAGALLMEYLEGGKYVGIDPNEWLRNVAMKQESVRKLVNEKQARFLSVDNFDASSTGMKFDYIFANSILTHFAHWQLDQFFSNTAKVLEEKGRILASIQLAEGNSFGNKGSPDKKDSMHRKWNYPDWSYFTYNTVVETAKRHNLVGESKPEYTEFYSKRRPFAGSDWFVFYFKK
jgi:cyclopropane fatty-acyl-phospholipid synthase-like methyltransferase